MLLAFLHLFTAIEVVELVLKSLNGEEHEDESLVLIHAPEEVDEAIIGVVIYLERVEEIWNLEMDWFTKEGRFLIASYIGMCV